MLGKVLKFATRFRKSVIGFISWSSIITLVQDVLKDRRDSIINQFIDRTVSNMPLLEYIARCITWTSENVILLTVASTCLVVAGLHIAAYIEARRDRARSQQVLAEVKELPPPPNAATLMPDLANLWQRIGDEAFWLWPSNATLNLYRKIEQDFRSLQASLDEDSRNGIERALAEAREILREKVKDI